MLYSNDGLNRLTDADEGTLSGGSISSRTHSLANEILTRDVDSDDPTYFFAWDEGWRLAAVYRGSDSNPKERFLHHQAGNSGYGGSSYIDDLVLRDRDANTAWTSASDGTLEQRYYCQNWRHDVVALVTSDGKLAERARYSAYGVAFGIPLGDVNGDGACDSTDVGLYTPTPSGVRYDLNLDGTINASDSAIASANTGVTLGVGKLSNIGSRFGYAGYEADFATDLLMHVRNRVYHAPLGRWTRRDPLSYVDGASLYQYVASRPIVRLDAMGLIGLSCHGPGEPGQCTGGGATAVGVQLLLTTALQSVVLPGCVNGEVQWNPALGLAPCELYRLVCNPAAGGGVACLNGRKITCVWDTVAERDPLADQGMKACILEHENDHHDDIDCSDCTPGFVCRPNFSLGRAPKVEECKAYAIEIQCLISYYNLCKTVACRQQVLSRVRQMCEAAEALQRCSDNWWPTWMVCKVLRTRFGDRW